MAVLLWVGCGKCTVCGRDFLWLLISSREGPTVSRLWATWKRQPAFWAFVRGRCRRLHSPITEFNLPVFNVSPQPRLLLYLVSQVHVPPGRVFTGKPWHLQGWWRKGLGSLPSAWTLSPAWVSAHAHLPRASAQPASRPSPGDPSCEPSNHPNSLFLF